MNSNSIQYRGDDFGLYGVELRYDDRQVLRDVTLSLTPGEIHALAGSKNSGKSAICSVFTGEARPSSGVVRVGGSDFPFVGRRQAQAAGIALVSNVPMVFSNMTVGENFISGEPLWRRAFRFWESYLADMRAWLGENGVELPLDKPVTSLPLEDRLFVDILRKLYRRPKLLILDEAFERLTPARRRALLPMLRRELDKGMTVLLVTHKVEDALLIVDRLTVVRDGDVLITTPPGGLDQLSIIQLCYAQVEELDDFDITQQQFRQLMRYTGALVRDLPQAVAILDPEKRVRFINRQAEKLFSPGGENLLGRNLGELLGDDNERLADTILAAVDDGRDREWHNLPVRRAGGECLSDVTLRRILEDGNSVGYMLIIEDVSAREELRRNLVLSDNLASVGLLAAGVAHEVNNPLEIIGNYLTFLKTRVGDADSRRIVEKLMEEGARIQQIVNNLIVFSGNPADASARVDLPALCLELCDLLRFHNKDRRIAFSCARPEEGFIVRADPNEIRQVFLNLFRNSIDALRDGGRIGVDFARERGEKGDRVVMRFTDNGPGISLAKPADVFLPFVTTRKTGGKNHGLGLFIVYGIIEKYGGAISVENVAEGGCRFTISLPLCG